MATCCSDRATEDFKSLLDEEKETVEGFFVVRCRFSFIKWKPRERCHAKLYLLMWEKLYPKILKRLERRCRFLFEKRCFYYEKLFLYLTLKHIKRTLITFFSFKSYLRLTPYLTFTDELFCFLFVLNPSHTVNCFLCSFQKKRNVSSFVFYLLSRVPKVISTILCMRAEDFLLRFLFVVILFILIRLRNLIFSV